MYETIEISIGKQEESGVTVITHEKDRIWLKIHDIQTGLSVKNMSDLTIKETESICNKKKKKERI